MEVIENTGPSFPGALRCGSVDPKIGKNKSSHKPFVTGLLFLWTLPLLALSRETLRMETSADAMGATFSLVLYGEDRDRLAAASADAFAEVRRVDSLLSNYKLDSEWSVVNRDASHHPVAISRELFALLRQCLEYSRKSHGTFDITVGPLMQVWGFYRDSGHLPQQGELRQAMQAIGYRHIRLNPADHSVYFTRPGLNIDPGGVGKGYAVDRMAEVLRRDGIQSALISGGGSSIYGLGAPPDQPGWHVRIADPLHPESADAPPAAEVILKDESLSTSGSYEKFFVAEGRTWSHIMDPRTGYPAEGALSVSVISPRTLDSEVWAKPYFIMGRRWTAASKPRNFRVFFCQDPHSRPDKEKDKEQPCAWLQ